MGSARKSRLHGSALALLVVLSAFAEVSAGATPATLPAATRGPGAAEAYAALVAHLASAEMEGRGPNTKGIEKARDYLIGQLKGLGLKPAFGGSHAQPFQLQTGAKVAEQALAVLDSSGKVLTTADAGREFVPLGFSASGAFEAPAVFVGYGIVNSRRKYDSYGSEADAVKDKVVIAYRYEPQDKNGRSLWGRYWTRDAGLLNKARWAAERGAAAVLVVNPPAQGRAPAPGGGRSLGAYGIRTKVPMMYLATGLLKKILRAAGRKDPDAAMRELQQAADQRRCKPVVLPGVRLRGWVKLRPVRKTLHNVGGVLGGAGKLADQFVIVGAHYDHVGYGEFGSRYRGRRAVHPGADDNASGTAGVLMLAKWFADRAAGRDALCPAPASRRSILFAAFSGEEMGLWGSRHMASHLEELHLEVRRVTAMINLDMIGRMRKKKLTVWGVDSGDRLRKIVDAATRNTDLDVRKMGGGVGPSDNASFYRRKIPVLSFFTGIHKDYHTPGDTADKINAAGAVGALAVADRVLQQLWADPEPIAYRPPKRGAGRAAMAMATDAYLGVLPDVVSDASGCEISQVVAGGPAGQGGLKAGDVVFAWDGKTIGSLPEMLVALHAQKPGDEVTLKVRRGKKTLEIKVTLGKR